MKAQARQSWLDLAIQYAGSIEHVFELANANSICITDETDTSKEYLSPSGTSNVAKAYAVQHYVPATMVDSLDDLLPGGIEFMGIEIDFIVS